jgi:hypothetical protein
MLPVLLGLGLPLTVVIAFALAALRWGVDSRPNAHHPHRPNG